MARQRWLAEAASMGPRLCGRGDQPARARGRPPPGSLQWGRAFVGAEMQITYI